MPLDEYPDRSDTPWPMIDRSLLGDGGRPPPVPFPLELLPDTWRRWVEHSAQGFTSVDYVAQSLLAAVAAVCGGGIVVAVTEQWAEPLVLWQALVGRPSSGKSPALMAGRRLLDGIALEGKPGEGDQAPPVVADDTFHLLARELIHCPRGVTLWRDELADSMAEAKRSRERGDWLVGWSGGATVAKGRGYFNMAIERFPLNMVGAVQPDRFAEAFGESADGLAARFLYAWPEPASCGALANRSADDRAGRTLLQRIARLPGTAVEPSALHLEPDALARFEQILPVLRQQMREGEGAEAGWIGKGCGTLLRLAGLLTLLHWSEDRERELPGDVTLERLEDAYALWAEYFLPHARSVFQHAGRGDGDRIGCRAARWLRRAGLAQVSREDIRREALHRSVDAEGADRVIERLEAAGVLRPVATGGNLGRPRRRWEVNPELR